MNNDELISYRSGQIEGKAKLMIIRKSMSREEIEKGLNEIKKWSLDIHKANLRMVHNTK